MPAEDLHAEIRRITRASYIAVKGTGYGRVDIRMDQHTGKDVCFGINAQCGLSEDENFTSIGGNPPVFQ